MKANRLSLALGMATALFCAAIPDFAQPPTHQPPTPVAASAPTAVPSLVPYSGTALADDGKPISGETGITFLIYKEETAGEPLWAETQTVAIDAAGRYKVQLGAMNPDGLPSDLFATGEARWLGIQVAGQAPQARVLLASVPYALKSGDAATLGGLPASAFALAAAKPSNATIATGLGIVNPSLISSVDVTTTGGTYGYVPQFSGSSTIVDSPLFSLGANIGIGTTAPRSLLEIQGSAYQALGPVLTLSNTLGGGGAESALDFNTILPSAKGTYNPMARIVAQDATRYSDNLLFQSNNPAPSAQNSGLQTNMIITSTGMVGIGTTTPTTPLQVNGTVTATAFAGNGAALTGVVASNATELGGLAPNKFALLGSGNTFTANNTFTSPFQTFLGDIRTVGDTRVDDAGLNKGFISPGIRFGAGASGEGIASQRIGGAGGTTGNRGNLDGIDLYTASTARVSITHAGLVGIGTTNPNATLDVRGNGLFEGGLNVVHSFSAGEYTGSVSINSDLAMSRNPRMSFSGFMIGNLGSGPLGGFFIPDQNIVITRITGATSTPGHDCSVDAQIVLNNQVTAANLASINIGQLLTLIDSGAISVPVPAGTQIVISGVAASGCAGFPTFGQSPLNVFVNVEYAMQ